MTPYTNCVVKADKVQGVNQSINQSIKQVYCTEPCHTNTMQVQILITCPMQSKCLPLLFTVVYNRLEID